MIAFAGLVLLGTAGLLLSADAAQARPRIGFYGGSYRGGYRSSGYSPYSYGYGYYPRSYGYYPYSYGYSSYSYQPYGYYGSPNYGYYGPTYSVPSEFGVSSPTNTSSTLSSTTIEEPDTARITMNVPPDAEVWFDGTRTTSTGPVREFSSPALTPGRRYAYDIRARWQENGQPVDQTQHVDVTAGNHVSISFPR